MQIYKKIVNNKMNNKQIKVKIRPLIQIILKYKIFNTTTLIIFEFNKKFIYYIYRIFCIYGIYFI